MRSIPEYSGSCVSRKEFETEIMPAKEPIVFRQLVADWPLVQHANRSLLDGMKYITSFDNHTPVYTVVGAPSVHGRLFYSDDLTDVNFKRLNADFTNTMKSLYGLAENPKPHAVSIQAASVKQTLPGLLKEHNMPCLDASIEPTIWVSNQSRVAAHFDMNDNIACVTMGKRCFTLFPPDQVSNLYVGPALNTPGGVPVSLVDLDKPDLEAFPRFQQALDCALFAELEPGDAIFIPSPWWHGVKSLESVNILVNYWWNSHISDTGPTAKDSLMMSMLTIASMDQPQREAWHAFFDYFVFKNSGNPASHLPTTLNDLSTQLTTQQVTDLYQQLGERLKTNC